MNFEVTYNAEQVAFRQEVREWLKDNLREGTGLNDGPVDPKHFTPEHIKRMKEFRMEFGKKGWYTPHLPKEIGGGGMSPEMALILEEELGELIGWRMGPGVGPPTFIPSDIGMSLVGSILQLGTEEQKERFLPPILNGEWQFWELFTEPGSGSDLPSLQTTADRDGDEYVINGTKIFVGGVGDLPDYMATLAVTDRNAPRHRNLSLFLIPGHTEGITVHDLDILANNVKRMIHLDNVRVSASQMVGQEGDGWASFPANRSGPPAFPNVGNLSDPYRPVERLIDHCKETQRNGERLSADPEVQQVLTKAYVDQKILDLFRVRNYWMSEANWLGKPTKKHMTYEGSQVSMYGKLIGPRIAEAMLQAIGPTALTEDAPWAPLGGALEFFHRHSIVRLHPGGTVEIQKLRVFRGLVGSDFRVGSG